MPLCHAAVDLAFITDDDAKMLKNARYCLLIMDSNGGLPPRDLRFSKAVVELMFSYN